MARRTVELGQKYQETNNPRSMWEVEFVYQDGHGLPHARLRNLNNHVDARTFSCAVIMDTSRFRPVAAIPDRVAS